MKKEMYRWLHGLFLGAALMVLALQYADIDRSKERFDRSMAVAEEQQTQRMLRPTDYNESKRLTEKSLAISSERSADPWVIRNLGWVGLFFIAAALCVTMVELWQNFRQRAGLSS